MTYIPGDEFDIYDEDLQEQPAEMYLGADDADNEAHHIYQILDHLEGVLDVREVPMTKGKGLVDLDACFKMIDRLRTNLPVAIQNAEKIFNEYDSFKKRSETEQMNLLKNAEDDAKRKAQSADDEANAIIEKAKEEAQMIIEEAENEAKRIVSKDEIHVRALEEANKIKAAALSDASKAKEDANIYVMGSLEWLRENIGKLNAQIDSSLSFLRDDNAGQELKKR